MQKIGEFFYNHVLTGYGYAKDHLEKSQTASSRAERIFHSIIGNIERVPLIGSALGLIEGIYHGVRSLSGRASNSFPQETAVRINEMVPLLLSTTLESAIARGDIDEVRALIEADPDPELIEFERLLDRAQGLRQPAIAKLLLEKQGPGEWGSLLNSSIMHGYDEVTLAFIEEGADLNQPNVEGNTPAHLAASRGNLIVLRALITDGADLTKRNDDGDTPLESAVKHGKKEVVVLLLEHKDRLGDYKGSALKKALASNELSIIRLINQS
jgi:hypothetical protein